ncbi:hypothetical protein DM081_27260 [Klebsiella pneumoniae]|nr:MULTISPECIES: hypothetical protein [Enterobacteriaceae]HDL8516987.1 hypothetical protein [Yersinia enterocolitica]MBM3074087.1 hypothetical protein [Lelliottia sp. RWM.1]MDX7369168.1 hypothetical protein [Klebsiella pneumoniae]RCJ74967.1 hypothetical protein DM081_27260 [Klebsiella pneumoniae]HDL8557769.1 hypothetical protein [Yersinia enterocolitica]
MEHDKKTAQEALIKSQGHVLVHGRTGTGKSKLLEETTIPDCRHFDFVKMCKSTCYFDLPFLCCTNEGIYLDDIMDAKEFTVILDSVEFPQNIHDSFLYGFLKIMSARGRRVIAVAFTSDSLENFKPLFEYEIETLRLEDGSFTCTTTSKTGSVELLLKNRYCINDDDNEDTFALARDVSDQLSIIVNAFDKDNAQEIIVEAAGEIQSLVQNDCIERCNR